MSRPLQWSGVGSLASRQFVCGFCSNRIASVHGWSANFGQGTLVVANIFICPNCGGPTFFDINKKQLPGVAFGSSVESVPEEVNALFEETRNCLSVGAYTASVLCSRKLLMNIAVNKGAKEGETFIGYVNFLADSGWVPPDSKEDLDHIRSKGNEANHKIPKMTREDAEELISFLEMLLKFMYEFPERIKKKKKDKNDSADVNSKSK